MGDLYAELLNLFHKTALAVSFGDTLEFLVYPRHRRTLNATWLDQRRMRRVLKYRNTSQLVLLPVEAGMNLAGE
jgi:hypothetical protein